MRGKLHKALVLLITVALLTVTFGLAVPSITVAVQELGNGSGSLFSPVPTGTVCVPYAYVYYIQGLGWYGPYPLNNIQEVYPGNFTRDLPANTNISAAIYFNSNLISSGTTTLGSTLPAGYYTRVSINPSIDYNQALNGEFHVTVQTPEYTTSSSGRISLTIQELGNGLPTGNYGDYLVLYYDGGFYQIYIVVRCYDLLFVPESVFGGGAVTVAPLILTEEVGSLRENEDPQLPDFRRGHGGRCSDLRNLQRVIRSSPYLKKILPEIIQEIERKILEAESGS